MARKGKGYQKGRGDPLKGSPLNRLSFYQSRPINRDALRVVEPQDSGGKHGAPMGRKLGASLSGISRLGARCCDHVGRRQVFKADGTIILLDYRKQIS